MAGSIKGIVVEIGGDTSGLQNALKKVNSSTASLSKELKGINSLLKLDPKNTELLSQKQTVLKENIEQTSKKLDELRKIQEMADKTIAENGKISEENYRNLQREIINTENKLKQLKVEASKWTTAGRSIEEFGNKIKNISNKINQMGTTLTTKLTLPIAALATYSVKSFQEVDEGADIVIKKTGAMGEAAEKLEKVYKKVSGEVVGDFKDIGSAVGEINTRFGFTGEILENASKKFMEFAKINDMDVNVAVQKVSRYMGDAGIEASKYGEILDQLTSVAQASGISIESLAEYCTKYGAPMRALGLDTKESIAIFAGWEKAGVNTEIAFSGMKKAISNWGAAGKDSTKEFSKALEEIKKAPNIAKATTKAIEIFGAKAGPDLADAIRGGRFEYQEFLDTLNKSQGIVENTYEGIMDESDKVEVSMKKLKVQCGEVGGEILKTLAPSIENVLNKISDLVKKYNKLSEKEKNEIKNMVLIAASIGPVLKILGTMGKTIGTVTKGVGVFSQAIAVAKNNTTSTIPEINSLASKIGFLTTPLGLATTAIMALCAAYAAWYIADAKEKASLGGLREEALKQQKAWNNLAETRQNALSSSMVEIETYQKLANELKNITDENGKVKEGYEARAQTILGILNQALGTEYTMTGNIISQYQDLQNEIDKTISAKKAEAVLTAYQEEYGVAIKNEAEATKTLIELKQKLIEAAEKMASGNRKERKEAELQYSSIAEQIEKQKDLVSGYGKTIVDYEKLQTASVTGSAEEIKKAIDDIGISYESSKQKTEESIEQQISTQGKYVHSIRESLNEAKKTNDEYQAKILKSQVDTEQKKLDNLIESLLKQTSTVEELSSEQVEAWKNVANESFSKYSEAISKLPEPTQNAIQEATGVIALDTNLSKAAGNEGAEATKFFKDNLKLSDKAEIETENIATAINKDTSVKTAASNLAEDANMGFNGNVDGNKWGTDLSSNISSGMTSQKSKNGIIGAATSIADWIKSIIGHSVPKKGPLKDELTYMPDMIDNLVNGIESNRHKVINSAEKMAQGIYETLNGNIEFPVVQDFGKLQNSFSNQIADKTKTIFTTPTLNIYTQGEVNIRKIADEVNRIFGSQY